LRGGDAALPASPSLVRFLDDMVCIGLEKCGFGDKRGKRRKGPSFEEL
jgi:hypothetical protein